MTVRTIGTIRCLLMFTVLAAPMATATPVERQAGADAQAARRVVLRIALPFEDIVITAAAVIETPEKWAPRGQGSRERLSQDLEPLVEDLDEASIAALISDGRTGSADLDRLALVASPALAALRLALIDGEVRRLLGDLPTFRVVGSPCVVSLGERGWLVAWVNERASGDSRSIALAASAEGGVSPALAPVESPGWLVDVLSLEDGASALRVEGRGDWRTIEDLSVSLAPESASPAPTLSLSLDVERLADGLASGATLPQLAMIGLSPDAGLRAAPLRVPGRLLDLATTRGSGWILVFDEEGGDLSLGELVWAGPISPGNPEPIIERWVRLAGVADGRSLEAIDPRVHDLGQGRSGDPAFAVTWWEDDDVVAAVSVSQDGEVSRALTVSDRHGEPRKPALVREALRLLTR